MQSLEVSGAVRPIYGSLGVKRLIIRKCLNEEKGVLCLMKATARGYCGYYCCFVCRMSQIGY